MYNITKITNNDFKYVPLKKWNWKPKLKSEIVIKNEIKFRGFITHRRIGQMVYSGSSF